MPVVNYSHVLYFVRVKVLYLALFWYSLQKRRVASGTQFIFWLILLACQAVRWRSIIKQKDFFDTLPFIVEVLYFPVVLLMFFANCWPNVKPPHKRHKPNYQNLEVCKNHFKIILFQWDDIRCIIRAYYKLNFRSHAQKLIRLSFRNNYSVGSPG